MAVTIENKTSRRVLLRFNSGITRHLGPGEVLRDVEHAEVKGNDALQHVEARHVIAVDPPIGERTRVAAARRSKGTRADEAIEHIRKTPLGKLRDFLSPDEDRSTVLRAMEEKREA